MALTYSTMMPLGTVAPAFQLLDTLSNRSLKFQDIRGKQGTVVMFICNHCPYVKHIRTGLSDFARDMVTLNIGVVAINANDIQNYPEDAPDKMVIFAKANQLKFPYLYDETQQTAKAYMAACTPDFYLFDSEDRCVYRGRFDAATPGNKEPITGDDLRHAVTQLLANKPNQREQLPSMGCNIKWKA